MEKKYSTGKFSSFMKRNIYYFLMIACILAIGTMITIAALKGAQDDTNVIINSPEPTDPVITDPTDPVITDPDPIVFALPVADYEIGMDYVMDELIFSSTLNQWQVHSGIDFKAAEGANVLAAYDGVIKSITTDPLNGTVIVVEHAGNMQTIYSSLNETTPVILNQIVKKGDIIGTVSTSSLNEINEGSHLHFEVKVNGAYADPNVYLPTENK